MSRTTTLTLRQAKELRAEITDELRRLARAGTTEAESARHALAQALTRLESGEYGACSGCGQPIPFDRLIVVPATEHCVRCG